MTGLGHQTSIRAKWCAIEIYISLVQKKKKKKPGTGVVELNLQTSKEVRGSQQLDKNPGKHDSHTTGV